MKELESRDILRLTGFHNQVIAANLFVLPSSIILDYDYVWEASIISKTALMYFGKKRSLLEEGYYEKFWVKIKSK